MPEYTLGELYEHFLKSKGVSTDTRTIQKDQIFISLKGENFDGNKYAEAALGKGASIAVIDNSEYEAENTFLVEDGLQTLQHLAHHHRSQLDIPVIGLTGSNGKTTTKELLHVVLAGKMNVFATPGNLNNHIGVPLTLLQLTKDHELAIIELGANHLGEIGELCEICKPDYGIITNVGKDHLEGFGSFEGSLRANSELYHYLIENEGRAFVNSTDPILSNMAKRFKIEPFWYPQSQDDYSCELTSADPFLIIKGQEEVFNTQMIGRYNFLNIATALAVANYFGIEEKDLKKGLESYAPKNNRSQYLNRGDVKIILDAYNANPSSVEQALISLSELSSTKKVSILGDMYELGDYSKEEHFKIGKMAGKVSDLTLLCGELFYDEFSEQSFPGIHSFKTKLDLKKYLEANKISEGTILVKGSRGMKMEEVLEFL